MSLSPMKKYSYLPPAQEEECKLQWHYSALSRLSARVSLRAWEHTMLASHTHTLSYSIDRNRSCWDGVGGNLAISTNIADSENTWHHSSACGYLSYKRIFPCTEWVASMAIHYSVVYKNKWLETSLMFIWGRLVKQLPIQ